MFSLLPLSELPFRSGVFYISPFIALINGILGILTLVPILMIGKGKGFSPSLVATLIVYGEHPKYPAISEGTNISFGRASISYNVVRREMLLFFSFILSPFFLSVLSYTNCDKIKMKKTCKGCGASHT